MEWYFKTVKIIQFWYDLHSRVENGYSRTERARELYDQRTEDLRSVWGAVGNAYVQSVCTQTSLKEQWEHGLIWEAGKRHFIFLAGGRNKDLYWTIVCLHLYERSIQTCDIKKIQNPIYFIFGVYETKLISVQGVCCDTLVP